MAQKFNVRIQIINLINGDTTSIRQGKISKKEVDELWYTHKLDKIKREGVSNIPCDQNKCPTYWSVTGVLPGSCTLITWVQWQSNC